MGRFWAECIPVLVVVATYIYSHIIVIYMCVLVPHYPTGPEGGTCETTQLHSRNQLDECNHPYSTDPRMYSKSQRHTPAGVC
jgi:hypothetical protein